MKYMKADLEVLDLEMEDVILTSGEPTCSTDNTCPNDECDLDGVDCRFMG